MPPVLDDSGLTIQKSIHKPIFFLLRPHAPSVDSVARSLKYRCRLPHVMALFNANVCCVLKERHLDDSGVTIQKSIHKPILILLFFCFAARFKR